MLLINKLFNLKKVSIILLWMLLTSASPFIFYSWPGHPHKYLVFILLILMLMCMIYYKRCVVDHKIIVGILLMISYNAFALIYFQEIYYLNFIIQLISCIVIIAYANNIVSIDAFAKSYIIIMILMGVGGTITFFIHLLHGIEPIFSVVYSGNSESYFFGLTTSNSYTNIGNYRMMRFSGFFDESGQYCLCAFIGMLINKLRFNNKIYERCLIIFSIVSMSLGFYVSLLFYFIFFYFKPQKIKAIFLVFVILIISISYIYQNKESSEINSLLYDYTLARFEMSEDGLSGNSRALHTSHDKELFEQHPFLGNGYSSVMGSNHYAILATGGIIGMIFTYLPLLYLFVQLVRNNGLTLGGKIFILFSINLFHRPEISSILSMLLIYTLANISSEQQKLI